MPYAAGGRNLPDKRGGVQKVPATAGLDARYDFANNLSGVFSVNPDFSQVENEVLSLAFDYNEKFRSEASTEVEHRHDIQEHHERLEVEDVDRPLDRLLGRLQLEFGLARLSLDVRLIPAREAMSSA